MDTETRRCALVADDDPGVRRVLGRILRRCGYEVLAAPDGAEALSLFKERRPDVVLLDIRMPGVDGLSVCRALRADPGAPRVPVLLVTALGGIDDVLEGLHAGADDYICKPFDPVEVRARVDRALAWTRGRA